MKIVRFACDMPKNHSFDWIYNSPACIFSLPLAPLCSLSDVMATCSSLFICLVDTRIQYTIGRIILHLLQLSHLALVQIKFN